jgi:hypothetical protein
MAQQAIVPVSGLFDAPPELTMRRRQASCPYHVSYPGLHAGAFASRSRERCASGVGTAAVQLAPRPARVIAVAGGPQRAPMA